MDAARKLFASKGYDASNMDSVAKTAGVNKATVYYYFENKRALLMSLLRDAKEKKALKKGVAGVYEGHDLRQVLYNMCTFNLREFDDKETQDFYRIVGAECLRDPSIKQNMASESAATRDAMLKRLRPLIKKEITDLKTKQCIHQLTGSLWYYIVHKKLMQLNLDSFGSEESYVKNLIDVFVSGMV